MGSSMNNRATGNRMERQAGAFLERQGYQVLQYNLYSRHGEIDIVAREGRYLVFVEVKYRKDGRMGDPGEAVGARKQHRICKAAQYYLLCKGMRTGMPCRFDVIAIKGEDIELIRDAFPFFI